jgi:hypothetical protein
MTLIKPTIGQTSWGETLNTALDYLNGNTTTLSSTVALKAPINSPTFTGTVSGITASMVGLGNVNNTSDANKPVSTAAQTALDLKADKTSLYNYLPIVTRSPGEYYTQYPVSVATQSTVTINVQQRTYNPVWIPAAQTITNMGVRVVTGIANTGIKMALYSNVNNKPYALLQDFGSFATTTNNTTLFTSGTSYAVTTPGFYWVAVETLNNTAGLTLVSLPSGVGLQPMAADIQGGYGKSGWKENLTASGDAFPSTVTNALVAWSSTPMVFVGV